jgi:hypothetical protein
MIVVELGIRNEELGIRNSRPPSRSMGVWEGNPKFETPLVAWAAFIIPKVRWRSPGLAGEAGAV